ncbi:MAG: GvpL/GvpF family gas vesicle protein [Pseudomonadota bacterium]
MQEGKYIYCIIATDEAKHFGPIGIGGRGDEVHNVCYGGLSAVISNTPLTRYELSKDTLLAHQRVVEQVMEEYTVLPVRFCTVAESVKDIIGLLQLRRNEFLGLIQDLDNKIEIGLKVYWKNMKNVFEELVQENSKLKEKGLVYSVLIKDELLQLGKEVAKFLDQKREEEGDIWMSVLTRLAHQDKILSMREDSMVLNAAFLMERIRQQEFDEKIELISGRNKNRYDVKYVGPTPPYNFVNMELHLGKVVD